MKDMLKGLDGLWAQLEELHTGVTLTKEESRGHRDLALVLAEAEVSRFEVLLKSSVIFYTSVSKLKLRICFFCFNILVLVLFMNHESW